MGVAVLEFLAFGASQVATPGPANMALMSTGAGYGFRAALPFVGGVVLGKQLVIWPVGFGLMTLMADVPGLLSVLKWASSADSPCHSSTKVNSRVSSKFSRSS